MPVAVHGPRGGFKGVGGFLLGHATEVA
jgi:hypothetical protein